MILLLYDLVSMGRLASSSPAYGYGAGPYPAYAGPCSSRQQLHARVIHGGEPLPALKFAAHRTDLVRTEPQLLRP
jgi:hypothetical protein